MTRMSRTVLPLSIVLALTLFATPALATETGTTGYYNTPPKPSTTTPTTPAPANGTGPSRESSKPRTTSSSPSSTTSPTTTPSSSTSSPSTSSTLPFTGLDLRWVIGIGLLLIGAGVAIRLTARRQREGL